jgi:hypothetical protein
MFVAPFAGVVLATAGTASTVTVRVPVRCALTVEVAVMVAVPCPTAVTTPDASTVATVVSELDHARASNWISPRWL